MPRYAPLRHRAVIHRCHFSYVILPSLGLGRYDSTDDKDRYVGLPEDEDDFNFAEPFAPLNAKSEVYLLEESKLNETIAESRLEDKAMNDIRWQQRFANYKKAVRQLQSAVELSERRELSSLEKQGVIQAFEFTHELAWNLLRDYLQDQGNQNIKGSKDATREAFKVELIADGEQWMAMIQSRNVSSHTYNEETAEQLVEVIVEQYFPLFVALQTEMGKYLS